MDDNFWHDLSQYDERVGYDSDAKNKPWWWEHKLDDDAERAEDMNSNRF
jgi:hypothetical protein